MALALEICAYPAGRVDPPLMGEAALEHF
jgi:hypothetical protein